MTSHTRSMIYFLMLLLGGLAQPGFEAVTTAQITSPSTVSAKSGRVRAEVNFWLKLRAAQVERKTDLGRSFRFDSASDRLAMIFGAPLFATITVNGTADGTLATLAGNSTCDLREAIQAANTNASVGQCAAGSVGLDTIQFNLGAGTPTINLVSALPTVTQQLIINGNTGGSTRIELNGTAAGAGAIGVDITAGGSTINDLVINRFSGAGIRMQNGSGNVVQRCWIGINAAGTAAAANGNVGIFILNSSGHTIGGASGAGNVVSGNALEGIIISGAAAVGNQILGNRIGTDPTGTFALSNGQSGISLINAPSNTIGSATAGNLISGNLLYGISVVGSNGTQIFGNRIGVNQSGSGALANSFSGIYLSDANNTVIGGTAAGAGNLISGNLAHGIEMFALTTLREPGGNRPALTAAPVTSGNILQGNIIGANLTATAALPNGMNGILIDGASGNTIGGLTAAARNYISGNAVHGVEISNLMATGNQVQGNYIGLNFSGTAKIGNGGNGVFIKNAGNNLIGGAATGAGNVVSGNDSSGIEIGSAAGTQVQGNLIGTNAAGTAAIGNMISGVVISSANNNIIGGTAAGARNVISGNGSDQSGGIALADGAAGNQVQGNFIGTDITGTLALGNSLFGVQIANSADNNVIGGTTAAARNIISGNDGPGVRIQQATTNGNQLLGNYIGLNVTGTAAIANTTGVTIEGANGNAIGGNASGAGNVISGNTNEGISLFTAASNNTIQGNFIGTQANGTSALGNNTHGIFFQSGLNNNNIVGGAGAAANIIAFNLSRGISMLSGTGNRITQNSIFSNDNRGIDLAGNGLTANDAGDPDTGPNNLQNFPVLNAVSSVGTISGSLDSTAANSAYPVRIEFFANSTSDGCANGEGETFIGFTTLTAPGAFTATVTLIPGKSFISATAIDNNGNTSEFSACRKVNAAPTINAAAPLTRQQGSPAINSTIAIVSDADQTGVSLMVTATPLTGTGVTISNLTVVPTVLMSTGEVGADVTASCTATNSTFTLTVTDNAGETAIAILTVNVTPNSPPTLGVYPATNIATVGGSATVTPSAAPTDNGTIAALTAAAPGFTGTLTGNPSTGVISVTNAGPSGSYTVTVTATDNCGATTTATFTLSVACPPLTVNSLADTPDANVSNGICADASGNCTLRAAIEEANVQTCGNIINFSVNGTIQLGSALPALAANITLNGPGANLLTVRRNTGGNYRIFAVNSGQTVTINGLTIRDGSLPINNSGGGILNSGNLTLNACVVTNNTAGTGAGIFSTGSGSLTIANSTVSNNNATAGNSVTAIGGGLLVLSGAINISNSTFSGNTNTNPQGFLQGSAMSLQDVTATLTNCTVSGNTAGSIIVNNAVSSASTLTLTSCTVANNSGNSSATIDNSSGGTSLATLQLRNTLTAGNSGQPNFRNIGNAVLTSLGNNLDSDGSSGLTNGAGGNIVGTSGSPINARLVPLADNGGPTQTHALRCDSPAIDAGTTSGIPATDARGQSRNQDGNGDNTSAVDIGALESQKYLVTNTTNSGAGSLRQALLDNDAFGGGLIAFNIPGGGVQTIAPSTS
ncbi:MAG TPA: choice-of-anchor Q domain-containing protein, partial [Blastocatellia bacterium]|nr:choice-of-anchor Q domain-containing protein [Blastocatellia bacterium]